MNGPPSATDRLLKAIEALSLPRLDPDSTVIYRPIPGSYRYSHHPHVARFGDRYVAMWSSGIEREDRPGQRVLWSSRADGADWAVPSILAECPPPPWRLTAGGWAVSGGRLHGYINRSRRESDPAERANVKWYPPLYVDVIEAGDDFAWSAPQAADADLVTNESPRRTSRGTWLLAGENVRQEPAVLRSRGEPDADLVYHPVPRVVIPAEELERPHVTPPLRPLGEPTWYERHDGTLICLLRDDHASHRLFASISPDDGITWSAPAATNLPDAKAKPASLALSDGRIVVVNNFLPRRARTVLGIMVSDDGVTFDRGAIVREGEAAYGYPSLCEHDDALTIAYSIDKHEIAVAAVPFVDIP